MAEGEHADIDTKADIKQESADFCCAEWLDACAEHVKKEVMTGSPELPKEKPGPPDDAGHHSETRQTGLQFSDICSVVSDKDDHRLQQGSEGMSNVPTDSKVHTRGLSTGQRRSSIEVRDPPESGSLHRQELGSMRGAKLGVRCDDDCSSCSGDASYSAESDDQHDPLWKGSDFQEEERPRAKAGRKCHQYGLVRKFEYKCQECQKVFLDKKCFTSHQEWPCMAKREKDCELTQCKVCSEMFPKFLMAKHEHEHYIGKIVKCEECGIHMAKGFMKRHVLSIHTASSSADNKIGCDLKRPPSTKTNIRNNKSKASMKMSTSSSKISNFRSNVEIEVENSKLERLEIDKSEESLQTSPSDVGLAVKRSSESLDSYQCEKCDTVYKDWRAFKRHQKWPCTGMNAQESKPFICQICSNVLPEFKRKKHEYLHKVGKIKKCDNCGKYMLRHCLKEHLRGCTQKKVHCKICSCRIYAENLARHVENVHGKVEKETCSICDRKFAPSNMASHMKCHKQRKKVATKCPLCDKCYGSNGALRRHTREVHAGACDWNVRCPKCDKVMASKNLLDRHINVIHKKKFACSVCGKNFQNKFRLADHMNVHNGKTPYKCDVCPDKYFSEELVLNNHVYNTHRKNRVCDTCGLTCSSIMTLERHMLTHDDVRRYECLVCLQKFSQRSSMMRHMLIHTGEKPIVCELCGARFRQSSLLKNHLAKQHK